MTTAFDPTQDLISVTDAAVEFLSAAAAKQPQKSVRFSTKPAGCSGYAYTLDFVDETHTSDVIVSAGNELKIAVDTESIAMLKGTIIDVEQLGLNRVIKYINPNVTGECGCGESFSVS
ncbi:MAG: iron-sulfur cluster assembly accessory protein [Pseudomonadales bacterium]|jgi:iron-sulfur cluster assembly accessory protein